MAFQCWIIAFDEVEHKPNFDLWRCRVGLPVWAYILENPHACKDSKMTTPHNFLQENHGQTMLKMGRISDYGLAMIFLRDSLCLSAVSLSRQRHDILDFSYCPLSRVLHVTLANWQRFGFEFHLRSSPSAYSGFVNISRAAEYFTACYTVLKVPMKWNFSPLFYSRKLKSMLHWFTIFEFGLLTSPYKFYLEFQSWPIRVKLCDIPRAVKICKLVRLTSQGV